jgi:hypothetical protein
MGVLDARTEKLLARFADGVREALGERLLCLAVHGSAAGDDWVPGRSDVNTAVIVSRVTVDELEALAPVVSARPRVLALPLVLDTEYLERARDTFPMELADLRDRHRVIAGTDVLGALRVEPAAVRRQCEQEARGKLLRLRALFLDAADDPAALERIMVESLKSFLILLRHLLQLRDGSRAHGYGAVLAAGETALGPLPTLRRLLDHRTGAVPIRLRALRAEFGGHLRDVERIVAALDQMDRMDRPDA